MTASTFHKEHFFRGVERLELLQSALFRHCDAEQWSLQAWAIFPNHYHFVANAPEEANLRRLIKRIHGSTGNAINKLDAVQGRMVWYRYRDTALTYEKSYLARLNYVHRNAVKHGVVHVANQYPFCSARWFEAHAERPFFNTVMSMPIDRLEIEDDF